MKIGIVGYGVYVPKYRIKVDEIARIWGEDPRAIKEGLLVEEKSVNWLDEDTATISVEAARNALKRARIPPEKIGAIYVGSESHPYAVKPTSTIVAAAIGCEGPLFAADLEFACKAGTAGIQICMSLVRSGLIEYGMAIGADTAQGRPGDALEYTAAAGGAAYIIGSEGLLAEIEGTYSFATDTPDFWRREGQPYPRHGARFTGAPAYFRHIVSASRGLMEKLGLRPEDFDYVVFHQPNGKFPLRAAKMLGFPKEKVLPGLVVTKIGNTYSGSSLIGLAMVLDQAKPGDRILLASFGSGAGSDAFSIVVTDGIEEKRDLAPPVSYYIKRKEYIDYAIYAKLRRLIRT